MDLVCQQCGAVTPSDACSKCDQQAPLWAKFCPHCGQDLTTRRNAQGQKKTKRQLCSDESCIGIIGDDGVCTDCGQRP
ncbi:MAG: hypothetical protein LBU12_04100 [Deltaproteobacteria bacterium]|nr:hypothetical protein [Deltaproteobacteria bacterium]